MKILVLSLLRLGDIIMQIPLLEGLRAQHPDCEITLVINRQFSQAAGLLEGKVDHLVYFDRELLQKSAAQKEFNLFWGARFLQTWLSELNQEEYDCIYNFTHNRLSGYLSGLIRAKQRKGIYSVGGAFHGLSNPWIQFFNAYFGLPEASGFHYTELLAKSLGISLPYFSPVKNPRQGPGKIVIQPLTSDAKKNWDLRRFAELVTLLKSRFSMEIVVLGADFEREKLEQAFPPELLKICGLKEAGGVLRDARLLISGDTSIKHVAAMQGTPILELALGSSQPLQIGAYSNNSVILQPRVSCGPCPHSEPCSQSSHRCGEQLSAEAVASAAALMMSGDSSMWEMYSRAHPDLNVLKTYVRPVFGWTVDSLSVSAKEYFDRVNQRKMMVVEELDRRQQQVLKEERSEQRTRKLPNGGAQAS